MARRDLTGRAHFVKFPSRIDDLRRPYLIDDQVPYAVARTVTLARIGYENFINDFEVERRYLEEHAPLCRIGEDGVWHCLFVRHRGQRDGILTMPDKLGYVIWAAYLPGVEY